VVLLRLRVVATAVADIGHLAALLGDLLDDVLVVDHPILVLRSGRELRDEIVSAAGGGLGGDAAGQVGLVDVVDDHLGVVGLPPALGVDVVEPLVVCGHEVAPLQDLERPFELLVPILRDGGDRLLRAEPSVEENDHACARLAQELPPRRLVVNLRDVDPGPVVTHVHHLLLVAGVANFLRS
jgi:hypothetical protein